MVYHTLLSACTQCHFVPAAAMCSVSAGGSHMLIAGYYFKVCHQLSLQPQSTNERALLVCAHRDTLELAMSYCSCGQMSLFVFVCVRLGRGGGSGVGGSLLTKV